MTQIVNEKVKVLSCFDPATGTVTPEKFRWQDRLYRVKEVGMRHPERHGRIMHHIFSVSDGATFFRLRHDPTTLHWTLEAFSDGLPD